MYIVCEIVIMEQNHIYSSFSFESFVLFYLITAFVVLFEHFKEIFVQKNS